MEINFNCKDNSMALKQQLNRVVKIFTVLFSIVGVWFLFLGLCYIIPDNEGVNNVRTGIYYIVFGFVIPIVFSLLYRYFLFRQYNENNFMRGEVNFSVTDEDFVYILKNQQSSSTINGKLNAFSKVVERQDSFVLYMGPNFCLVLPKNGTFEAGSSDALRVAFANALGKKFVLKSK